MFAKNCYVNVTIQSAVCIVLRWYDESINVISLMCKYSSMYVECAIFNEA